jgi:formylglycine-generating enzyme required for sulfatase activity
MSHRSFARGLLIVAILASGVVAQAVTIDTVHVGNPGNAGELSGTGAGGWGPDVIVGGVAYTYQIGKFEVTTAQYTQFLNAVAQTDTYGLYNAEMWSNTYGCKIERSGTSGSYAYSVAPDRADRPVNYVSWGDAARFANWLGNGQPTGPQGMSTTEDGSYRLSGATSKDALLAVTRKPSATWVIPTEDEWYKAAYHKNDGVTANYWDYPTSTNSVPDNGNPGGDTGNSVNYYDGDKAVGSPYYTTPVGFFALSKSACGTFDQAGNLLEWCETDILHSWRGVRGGGWGDSAQYLPASSRGYGEDPSGEGIGIGFRVASTLPEPSSLAMLVGLVLTTLLYWWRKRAHLLC